jgi:hypothetical protein
MLLFALALQSATWAVEDTTDNNTGKRDVSVIQMSENSVGNGRHVALSLDCSEGAVRMLLIWPGKIGSGYLPVKVDWDVGPWAKTLGRPASWEVSPYGEGIAEAPAGDLKRIVDSVPEEMPFRVTVYRAGGETTLYFRSNGLKAAYARIASHCR